MLLNKSRKNKGSEYRKLRNKEAEPDSFEKRTRRNGRRRNRENVDLQGKDASMLAICTRNNT